VGYLTAYDCIFVYLDSNAMLQNDKMTILATKTRMMKKQNFQTRNRDC